LGAHRIELSNRLIDGPDLFIDYGIKGGAEVRWPLTRQRKQTRQLP
jgi:hypothetical protein